MIGATYTLRLASRVLSIHRLRKNGIFPLASDCTWRRTFSSLPGVPADVGGSSNFLQVQHASLGGNVLELSHFWLRDHCRCSECYSSSTHQRNTDILQLRTRTEVKRHDLKGETVNIQWSDGHESSFEIGWLLENTHEGRALSKTSEKTCQRTLWNGALMADLQLAPIVNDQLRDETVLSELFRRVIRYGFAKIEQVPPTAEDTRRLCQQITRLSNTFFGSFWEISNSRSSEHKDSGYGNGSLEAHSDNTYFTEAQGIIVFHMTELDGEGGESLLVDGFQVADQLKRINPEAYRYLSNTVQHSEFIEPGEHFKAVGPILRHDPFNQLEQIRFNMYDRAPLSSISQRDAEQYYEHVSSLASIIRRKENEYWFRLTPGTVLVFDNWRLLHGRASYTGKRVLNGCFFSRSEFMSRARHFNIV